MYDECESINATMFLSEDDKLRKIGSINKIPMSNGDFVQTKFIRTSVRFKLDKPNIILVKLTIFSVQFHDLSIVEAEHVIVIKFTNCK